MRTVGEMKIKNRSPTVRSLNYNMYRDFPQSIKCPCRTTSLLCRLERPVTSGKTLELSKTAWSAPCLTTSATKKSQWCVILVGNSLLRSWRHPCANLTCSLERCAAYLISGVSQRDHKALYSPLADICCCCFTARSLRNTKNNYRALGEVVRDFGVQVVFFISLHVQRKGFERAS